MRISDWSSDVCSSDLCGGRERVWFFARSAVGTRTSAPNFITAPLGQQETNMNLHNTSHLGRPGTNDLVPSRYALRVGEIDVLVVSDGVLPLPTATMATNADPAALAAWLDAMFLPPRPSDWPLHGQVG